MPNARGALRRQRAYMVRHKKQVFSAFREAENSLKKLVSKETSSDILPLDKVMRDVSAMCHLTSVVLPALEEDHKAVSASVDCIFQYRTKLPDALRSMPEGPAIKKNLGDWCYNSTAGLKPIITDSFVAEIAASCGIPQQDLNSNWLSEGYPGAYQSWCYNKERSACVREPLSEVCLFSIAETVQSCVDGNPNLSKPDV